MKTRTRARVFAALFSLCLSRGFSADAPPSTGSAGDIDDAENWPTLEGEGLTVPAETRPSHRDEIRLDPADVARATDLSAIIAEEAGLALTSYGGYGMVSGLNARGFASARIRTYLDGTPLNSPLSGEADLSWIDVSSVTKTTIEYGSGTGATVRLSTVDDSFRGFTWTAGLSNLSWIPPGDADGLADTQRVFASAKYGTDDLRWTVGWFGTRAANRFPYEDAEGSTAYRRDNAVLDTGLRAGVSGPISPGATLALAVSGYLADKDVAGSTGSASSGHQDDARTRESLIISVTDDERARYDATVALSHSFASIRWEDPTGVTDNATNSFDLSARVRRFATDAHTVGISTEAAYVACDSDSIGEKGLATATFGAALESRFPGRVSTSAELRVVAPSGGDGWTPVPSVSAFKGFGGASRIGISAFRAYKRPDLNALYWSGDPSAHGNPDLKSEDGWGGEILAETRAKTRAGITIASSHSAHGTWYRNAVSWQASGGVWTPENMGEAIFIGTDHSVSVTPFDWLTLEATYTFLRTWVLTGGFTLSDGKRIPYQSEHRVILAITGAKDGWRWRVSPRYEGPRFVTIMNVTSLPGYFVLDASVTKAFENGFELSIEAKNILGESYETVEGYPMPGTSVSVGLYYTYR